MGNKALIIDSDLALEEKVMALLVCTAQEMTAKMQRNIKPMNLSLLQVQILHVLSKSVDGAGEGIGEGRLTVNQIKALMVDESPNVSRSLNKLMEHGYITKERDIEDQRVVHIAITPAGEQAHEDADKELLKVSLGLSRADCYSLYALLSKI